MLQAFLVHPVGGGRDLLQVRRGEEAADDRVALAVQLLDEIRHAVLPVRPIKPDPWRPPKAKR